ncbi:hypothetical protein Pelo_15535 [Pelomyxa schiedti]|nr:hypothetical protein Pelo_15535 [Pelomyxa schiedti]
MVSQTGMQPFQPNSVQPTMMPSRSAKPAMPPCKANCSASRPQGTRPTSTTSTSSRCLIPSQTTKKSTKHNSRKPNTSQSHFQTAVKESEELRNKNAELSAKLHSAHDVIANNATLQEHLRVVTVARDETNNQNRKLIELLNGATNQNQSLKSQIEEEQKAQARGKELLEIRLRELDTLRQQLAEKDETSAEQRKERDAAIMKLREYQEHVSAMYSMGLNRLGDSTSTSSPSTYTGASGSASVLSVSGSGSPCASASSLATSNTAAANAVTGTVELGILTNTTNNHALISSSTSSQLPFAAPLSVGGATFMCASTSGSKSGSPSSAALAAAAVASSPPPLTSTTNTSHSLILSVSFPQHQRSAQKTWPGDGADVKEFILDCDPSNTSTTLADMALKVRTVTSRWLYFEITVTRYFQGVLTKFGPCKKPIKPLKNGGKCEKTIFTHTIDIGGKWEFHVVVSLEPFQHSNSLPKHNTAHRNPLALFTAKGYTAIQLLKHKTKKNFAHVILFNITTIWNCT